MTTHHPTADRADQGFTLIEILIVIVILGVLAVVVVFSVRGINDRGQESACETDARILATAIESYFANTGNTTIAGIPPDGPEQTLIDADYLRDFSEYWNITPDGLLDNVAPCT